MRILSTILSGLRHARNAEQDRDRVLEAIGRLLSLQVAASGPAGSLGAHEFRVYSQWGDDGIIQWLVSSLGDIPRAFIEFGVEDYRESNTRFLMVNNQWRGLVMDGSPRNIASLREQPWFWRHDLEAIQAFVTRENVDGLIEPWAKGQEVGLLHIDIDGNDYWVWDAIQCIRPVIAIIEYNALFGPDRPITIPYQPDFNRNTAHYSRLYAGASLPALAALAAKKGYALIGTNSAGNNAYFVRRDKLSDKVREASVHEAYTRACFRESRNRRGTLDFLGESDRASVIRGMPVFNVETGQVEDF